MGKKRKSPAGRSGGRYVGFLHAMLHSAAYRGLSVNARALLVEVTSLYNGANPGEMFVSVRDGAKMIGLGDIGAASAALKELVDHGFLRVTSPGSFRVKVRHATGYRLTWQPWNDWAPTNNWSDWTPTPGSPAWKRIERLRGSNLRCGKTALSVLDTCTARAKEAARCDRPVQEYDTVPTQFQQVTRSASVTNSDTQLLYHGVGAERASVEDCERVRALARNQVAKSYGGRQQLARTAAISPSKLSRFLNDEAGRRTLTVDQLERLGQALRLAAVPLLALPRRAG